MSSLGIMVILYSNISAPEIFFYHFRLCFCALHASDSQQFLLTHLRLHTA